MFVGGLFAGAYRALTWTSIERERTLVVLAPTHATVTLQNGPKALTTTSGVHSFSVMPGPIVLDVHHPELPPQTAPLTIPKGIGGLMIDVQYDADGRLEIGYF